MALDFNQDEQQHAGFTPIPPRSRVLVTLSINYPKENQSADYPLHDAARSILQNLSCTLTVQSPSFKGQQIRHRFNVDYARNGTPPTEGQLKAIRISRSQIRALLEANYGVSPNDASPQAAQCRRLNEWRDLEGMTFPIVVDAEVSTSPKDGRQYINNTLFSVITKDEPDFDMLRKGGEVISDQPLPQVAAAGSTQPAPASVAPDWARPAQQAPAPQQANIPWAQPATQPAPPPPPPAQQRPEWAAPTAQTQQENLGPAFPQQRAPMTNVDPVPF